ncbi:MAG: four-carbon acid sugar kinase family protein [Phycisphaeraceae bacterium]
MTSPARPLAIADDLTGALEVAAALGGRARRTVVPLADPERPRADQPDADLLVLDTDGRVVDADQAAARLEAAVDAASTTGWELVYKKIDSTLRGPIAAELALLRRKLPGAAMVICPANPPARRTVVSGKLYVAGQPLAGTAFARDPLHPISDSRVAAVLGLDDAAMLRLIQLREGAGAVAEAIAAAAVAGRPVVADAQTEHDLAMLAAGIAKADRQVIAVGSGGLAEAIAAELPTDPAAAPTAGEGPASPGLLFICGSGHPANNAMIDHLAAERGGPVVRLIAEEVDTELPSDDVIRERLAPLAEAIERGGSGVLAGPLRDEHHAGAADADRALAALLRYTGLLDELAPAGQMLVTGGQTASAVCRLLGGTRLTVERALAPGLVSSLLDTRPVRRVLSKPGGFGDTKTLTEVIDVLAPASGAGAQERTP